MALKTDGTVVAWGLNSSGQTDVPAGLVDVAAIAAGGRHTVALKADGTVVAWGFNDAGQTDVPAGLSDVTAIAAGASHTVALVTMSNDPPTAIALSPAFLDYDALPGTIIGRFTTTDPDTGDTHSYRIVSQPLDRGGTEDPYFTISGDTLMTTDSWVGAWQPDSRL